MLAAYLATAIALPVLHRIHHERHGDDHVHTAQGTVYFEHGHAAGDEAAAQHLAFDADLARLELAEVATAGALAVDCELAAFTLAECDPGQRSHLPNFGDQLLARSPHHLPQPVPDPLHGAGALEHLGASLLGVALFILAPPASPVIRAQVAYAPRARSVEHHGTHDSRGPPLNAASPT